MWLRKLKTKARNPPEAAPSVPSPTFSISSFKDIEALYEEEDNNNNNIIINNTNNRITRSGNKTSKLKFSNVLHRVRNATSLLRAFSNQKKVDGNVQGSVQTLKSLLRDDGKGKRVVLQKKQLLIEDKGLIGEGGVQEPVRDNVGGLENGDLEKKGLAIVESSSKGEVDGTIRDSKTLHQGDIDDEVDLEKGDLKKEELRAEESNSIRKVDGNVQESIQSVKSLQHGDKDDGVVLEKGDLEKEQIVVEESPSIVKVDDNVQESIQSLKSLHHVDKDDGVVSEKRDLEKDQVLIEEPSSVGEVGDVNADDKAVRIELPGTETRVVIFFTSLRVVRSTFEDCKYARTILHTFPVAIDERDLFMDGRFMNELQRIMGIDEHTNLTLPRVFIGGRYIGGAEDIRKLHEAGELKKYFEGLAPAPVGTCESCGGHGFILCVECNGSHKCYEDKEGFKACSGCNENGLVRCPSCSSAPL